MYIRLSDNSYPLTERQIKAAFPSTTFPALFRKGGYAVVFPTPKPELTNLQIAVEGAPELTALGTYQQTWTITDKFSNQADIDAFLAQELQTAKTSAKDRVSALYATYLYADVEVTFPSGPAVIQFRDDSDRMNLSNVVQAAQALIIAGTPTETLVYRTQDNVIQEVTAVQMVSLGMAVMAEKQALLNVSWGHRDNIDAMTTVVDVTDYDITTGWPE